MTMNEVPDRPRLREYLRLVPGPHGDELTLRGGAKAVTLRGRSVSELLPDLLDKLDGRRRVEDLARELPHVTQEVLVGALRLLNDQRLLADGPGDDPTQASGGPAQAQDRFWTSLGDAARDAGQRLRDTPVLVLGLGDLGLAVAEVLAVSGLGGLRLAHLDALGAEAMEPPRAATGPRARDGDVAPARPAQEVARLRAEDVDGLRDLLAESGFAIVCADVPAGDVLQRINAAAVTCGTPWLLAGLGDSSAIVGPLVVPHETACYECLRLRLLANDSYLLGAHGMRAPGDGTPETAAAHPARPAYLPGLIGALAAAELVQFVSATARPATLGAFLRMSALDTVPVRHDVLRVPRCPVCGPQRYRPQAKIWSFDAAGQG